MAKKVLLAFDMDDTFTDTRGEIYHSLAYQLHEKKLTEEYTYLTAHPHVTPLLWSKKMCGAVFEHVVQHGHFMRHAQPSPLMFSGLLEFLRTMLSHNWGPYITSVICTHRGFHEHGHSNTAEWLDRHNASDVFSEIHALDPAIHPNKLEFLRKQYPDYEILLLDDNPLHDPHTVHPRSDEVLIYEGIHTLPGYVNQDKFTTIEDFKTRVIRKMFGERGYERLLQQYADIA